MGHFLLYATLLLLLFAVVYRIMDFKIHSKLDSLWGRYQLFDIGFNEDTIPQLKEELLRLKVFTRYQCKRKKNLLYLISKKES